MIFQYQALDKNGDNVADYVDAPSEMAARQKIRSQGLYIIRLKKQEIIIGDLSTDKKSSLRNLADQIAETINMKMSAKNVGLFSRQLGTLLKAGLPLPTAIGDIMEQIDNKHFKKVVADVKERLEEGTSFSNALARHKNIFSEMYVNMVKVGENLGSLDQVIERLADREEKNNILMGKIRAALWYPSFMLVFASVIVVFIMINVIPRISEIFAEQKRDLPLPTEIVIGVSNFLSSFWFTIPLVIAGGIYFYKKYSQTAEGRRKIDELKLRLPLISNLYRKILVHRFTQNLGILVSNKVDIIKSFEIVKKIVSNVIIEEKIAEAAKRIKEGSSVSNALSRADFLPKLVIGMITAGEASDQLDRMLMNIGTVYETEIDLTITGLTSLIEPLIIVIMGVAIGTIVMSVMLPIMNMNMLVQ